MATYAQRRAVGDFGERLAAEHLERSGLVVVDRNFRCRHGEIDLVATEGDTVVVCEVKTRRGAAFGSPAEAVTSTKAARLRRLTAFWLAEHDLTPSVVRIDVVCVLVPRRGAPTVEHLVGVA